MPINKQAAYVKQLSPELQSKLWMTKINDTLASDQLTEKEKSVVSRLLPFLKPVYFDTKQAKLAKRAEAIRAKLQKKCGWDDDKVFLYLSNFYTAEEWQEGVREGYLKAAQPTRSMLIELPSAQQNKYLETLSPEALRSIWDYKWSDSLKSKQLSKAEKRILKSVGFFPASAYVKGSAEQSEMKLATDKAAASLAEKYGWSETKIEFYMGTIMTEQEFDAYIHKTLDSDQIENLKEAGLTFLH